MDWTDWARAAFALLLTLGLIALAAYGARRFGMVQMGVTRGERRLKVTESLMLDPRRRLVVVRFDGREHLLLLSPAGDKVVTDVEAKPEPPKPEAPKAEMPA